MIFRPQLRKSGLEYSLKWTSRTEGISTNGSLPISYRISSIMPIDLLTNLLLVQVLVVSITQALIQTNSSVGRLSASSTDAFNALRPVYMLRTRAKLWPEARQSTAQRTIGKGHVGVRTAEDRRSSQGRRFYINSVHFLVDRSFVLNSNKVSSIYFSNFLSYFIDFLT